MSCLSAFNRWLEEDWGFAYEGRIFAAPLLSLADPQAALVELESLLDRGREADPRPPGAGAVRRGPALARTPGPRPGVGGDGGGRRARHVPPRRQRLPPVRSGLGRQGGVRTVRRVDPLDSVLVDDRAIHDSMASMIVHGVFHRHPTLRAGSIENGSDWVAILAKRLRKKANQSPSAFPEDPLEVLRAQRLGRRRTTRRTSSSWPTRSASSTSCSAPTGRTAKASPNRCSSPRSSTAFSDVGREEDHARQRDRVPRRRRRARLSSTTSLDPPDRPETP